jgi:hypothetical protein
MQRMKRYSSLYLRGSANGFYLLFSEEIMHYASVSSRLLPVWKYHYSDGWVEEKTSSVWLSTSLNNANRLNDNYQYIVT